MPERQSAFGTTCAPGHLEVDRSADHDDGPAAALVQGPGRPVDQPLAVKPGERLGAAEPPALTSGEDQAGDAHTAAPSTRAPPSGGAPRSRSAP